MCQSGKIFKFDYRQGYTIPKTKISIDIAKKVTFVYLTGSKAVLHRRIFQQFPILLVFIQHFNTVNTLDMVDSGYSWT